MNKTFKTEPMLAAVVDRSTSPVLWNAQARALARDAIADTLGCMVAGRHEPSVRAVLQASRNAGSAEGACGVAGGHRAPPVPAARINGTAAHALDFDDNFEAGMSHASAVLVPALLAAGQVRQATGSQLVISYLVGLQAQAEVGRALGYGHYTAGWHATSTVGCIGTACGVAHLLGADAEGMVQAMSIAVSFASGTKGQFGTAVKPFHAGLAAGNAVEAAFLAEAGLTGRTDIMERDQGLLELFSGPGGAPLAHGLATDSPDVHAVADPGLAPKRFPCCGSTHLAIDAVLDLMQAHQFTSEQVAALSVKVGRANYRNLPYTSPRTGNEARFSMHYCLARALRSGTVTLADFADATVASRRSDPLLRLIEMTHRTEAEESAAKGKLPHEVEVVLRDGTRLRHERRKAKGTISEPFSEADKTSKYAACIADLPASGPDFDRLQQILTDGSLKDLDPLLA